MSLLPALSPDHLPRTRAPPERKHDLLEMDFTTIGTIPGNLAGGVGRMQRGCASAPVGFGETRPVAPNEIGGHDDPAGRALRRRVELGFCAPPP